MAMLSGRDIDVVIDQLKRHFAAVGPEHSKAIFAEMIVLVNDLEPVLVNRRGRNIVAILALLSLLQAILRPAEPLIAIAKEEMARA